LIVCFHIVFYLTVMSRLEKTLVLLCVIGLVLKMIPLPGAAFMTTLAVLGLSLVYVLFGFALLNGIGLRGVFSRSSYKGIGTGRIIASIFVGYVLGCLVFSILFRVMAWPGSAVMFYSSVGSAIFVLIVCCIAFGRASLYLKHVFVRAGIAIFINVVLFVTPLSTLSKVFKNPYLDRTVVHQPGR